MNSGHTGIFASKSCVVKERHPNWVLTCVLTSAYAAMGTCYDDIACLLLTHESSRWDQQYSHAVRLRDHRLRKLKLGVVSEFSHLVRSFSCSAVLSTDPR